ncbi:MAG: PIG-L family deacetylase [Thermoplasmata archaeon]|nr:PIG-L family deacetylase [Thermoplasmata archaeon]
MRILVISPHADDAELGAGATISRFLREGSDVLVYLVATKEKFPEDFPIRDRVDEFKNSMDTLGVKKHVIANYPVRKLHEHRQQILEDFVKIRDEFRPNVVFIPSLRDIHQDHQVVAWEAYRAFNRRAKILGYELPWNARDFAPNFFVRVSEEDVKRKLEALDKYESQKLLGRNYLDPEFLRAQLRFRGAQCNSKYAEAFETINWFI